jgi:hypothetical protein
MSGSQSWEDLKFDGPGFYRIRVRGHLEDMWTERMSGLVITRVFTENKQPMSILIGRLQDQAALAGVMNALYSLHLSVFSIELLDDLQP